LALIYYSATIDDDDDDEHDVLLEDTFKTKLSNPSGNTDQTSIKQK
jgi:hypothetical protein